MKTLKLIFTAAFVLTTFSALSIERRQIVINGLTLEQSYTPDQVISICGTSAKHTNDQDVCDTHEFTYNGNSISTNDGVFDCFELVNNSFKLNGVVGVGDTKDKINLLNPYKITSTTTTSNGETLYYAYITDDADDLSSIYFYTKNGVITKIHYLNMSAI